MVKYGVFGTGVVGQTLASKLVELGHEVMLGSRDAANETAQKWVANTGERASNGTFADAASFGDVIVNATAGTASLAAFAAAGNVAGKLVIDVANPLDFSN